VSVLRRLFGVIVLDRVLRLKGKVADETSNFHAAEGFKEV
jgi:hypothetical protein